jgi:cell division protein FtsN
VLLGEYPDKLPQALRQAVQQHTKKDIIKNSSKGQTMYIVGPFAAFADAEKLQAQLKTKGFEVTIE